MKNNQKGSIGIILLIVLVVVAIIIGGVYIANNKDSKNEQNTSAQSGNETEESNQSYLEIPEWNVKFERPNSIPDLEYVEGGTSDAVTFESKTLEELGLFENTGPESQAKTGVLVRVEANTSSVSPNCDTYEACANDNGWAHATVEDYFFYFDPTHGTGEFYDSTYRTDLETSIQSTLQSI